MEENRLIALVIFGIVVAIVRLVGEARRRSREERRLRNEYLRQAEAERAARAREKEVDLRERKQLDEEVQAWERVANIRAEQDKAKAIRNQRREIEEYDWKD